MLFLTRGAWWAAVWRRLWRLLEPASLFQDGEASACMFTLSRTECQSITFGSEKTCVKVAWFTTIKIFNGQLI
jgi:hypothetical protein